jgi:hypothetical protein
MKESRECLAIVVDRKIKSNDVLYYLSDLFLLHGKRFVKNITVPVAKHDQMILLGIVHGNAHHICAASSRFKNGTQ